MHECRSSSQGTNDDGGVGQATRFVGVAVVARLNSGPRAPAPRTPPRAWASPVTMKLDRFVIFLVGFVIIFAVLTFLTVLVIAPFAQALTPHLLS